MTHYDYARALAQFGKRRLDGQALGFGDPLAHHRADQHEGAAVRKEGFLDLAAESCPDIRHCNLELNRGGLLLASKLMK